MHNVTEGATCKGFVVCFSVVENEYRIAIASRNGRCLIRIWRTVLLPSIVYTLATIIMEVLHKTCLFPSY